MTGRVASPRRPVLRKVASSGRPTLTVRSEIGPYRRPLQLYLAFAKNNVCARTKNPVQVTEPEATVSTSEAAAHRWRGVRIYLKVAFGGAPMVPRQRNCREIRQRLFSVLGRVQRSLGRQSYPEELMKRSRNSIGTINNQSKDAKRARDRNVE